MKDDLFDKKLNFSSKAFCKKILKPVGAQTLH